MPGKHGKDGRFIKVQAEVVDEEKATVTNIYEYVSRLNRQHDMPRLREAIAQAAVRRARTALMDTSVAIDDRVHKAIAILTLGAGKLEELETHRRRR